MPRAVSPIQDSVQDSVLQESEDTTVSAALSPLFANAGRNILGMGYGFLGYTEQAVVPDTDGAVGPTQFVQFVNESFVVFNKSNGSVAYGPADGNTLWQVLGSPCSTNSNLDEVVQFDKLANRWVVLMPVFMNPGSIVWPSPRHRTQPMGDGISTIFRYPITECRTTRSWRFGRMVTMCLITKARTLCLWAQPPAC